MAHSKRWLQGTEEAFSLRVQLFHIDGLRHECVGARLADFLFVFTSAADDDDGCLVGRIGLNAPANLNSVNSGNHDIQYQEVWFAASDFYQGSAAFRGR